MTEDTASDDPIIAISLHEITVRLLHGLLRAMAELTEPGAERMTRDERSYLVQTLDNAADLDVLFDALADELERDLTYGKGVTNSSPGYVV